MSEKIKPTLSAEEWANMDARGMLTLGDATDRLSARIDVRDGTVAIVDDWLDSSTAPIPVVIAVANNALPDSDPRKITRARVNRLRAFAKSYRNEWGEGEWGGETDTLESLAGALESYLPPPHTE